MHIDPDEQVLHCQVGSTWLHYQLVAHGDWMELGNKDEQDETRSGTVEHRARSATTRWAAGTACGRAVGAGSSTT
jgi:hypothetical protein